MTGPNDAEVLFKYEKTNPGGSIKDRAAHFIVEEAEKRGLLAPGGTIIESSSGNFGISLSMIGAAKGYRVIILVDPKTTENNLALLKCFGAEVIVVTEQDDCGSYHKTRIALANQLAAEIPHAFRPDQCFNLLNSEAHYRSTAREIFADCGSRLDLLVAPVSTGGQLGGLSRYIKTYHPETQVVGVDADGSAIFGGQSHAYRIPGIGLGWTPENLPLEYVDCAFKVRDEDAYLAARAAARHEGVLMGPSSGACLVVALRFAEVLGKGKRVVCMVSDGGDRYIQTLFSDTWLESQGFPCTTDLTELRTRARSLRAWSMNPRQQANYQEELKAGLEVPDTTLRINQELRQPQKEKPHTRFLD